MTEGATRGGAAGGRELLVSLQYLRAVAALLVVYFHATIQIQSIVGWQVDLPLTGAAGVDIFFVLSGYVMYVSTHGRAITVGEFVRRRLVRIVPLYWLMTLAAAAVAAAAPWLLRSTAFDPAHLAASLAFVPWRNPISASPVDPAAITPVIVPGWTLNFEMMFYLLFAISLVCRGDRARLAMLTALVAAVFALCWPLRGASTLTDFYASPIIFEFAAGTWLAALLTGRTAPRSPLVPALLLVAALATMLVLEWRWQENDRLFRLGLPALVMVACAVQIERTGTIGFSALWDALGNASYSIYLSHIFVIAGLRIALETAGIELLPAYGALFVVAAVALSASVGLFVHVLLEKPLTQAAAAVFRGARGRRDLPVSVA